MSAFAQLCRSQPKKLLLAEGQSLLDACRAGNPAVTRHTLVDTLVGTAPQDLAAAVRERAISETQAHAALEALRAQMVTLTAAHPVISPAPPAGKGLPGNQPTASKG
jgi:hypothetical protein